MPDPRPRFIEPPQLFRSPRYTNVVVANGFAFIQTAFDAQGDVVGVGDFRAQAEQTYRATLPLLVKARRAILGDLRPASTAVVAGLAREELLVEVDAIVALPTA
ncbi:MAG TPA: hypothetical protein VI056_10370 [Candidatus Limnocylindria bacterium]